MNATGIVRRIDDLGRVVIPKEVRRVMKIQEGDPLEIFVNEGQVILQKYSVMKNISDIYKSIGRSLSTTCSESIVIICDCDNILYSSSRKFNTGDEITKKLENKISNRFTGLFDTDIITNQKENITFNQSFVKTITVEGDSIGAIILLGNNIDETSKKLVQMASLTITNHMES